MSTTSSASADKAKPNLSWTFSLRDLFNTAIFSAIFIATSYMFGMLGILGPLMWLVSIPVMIFFNAIPFIVFFTRVGHAGMLMLFSLAVALLFMLDGAAITTAGVPVLSGFMMEAIAFAGHYRARWAAIASSAVVGLTAFSPFLPMLINREAYFSSPALQSMGEGYVQSANALFTPPLIAALAAACVLSGLLGGFFGTVILRKHFAHAGLGLA